MSSNKKTPDVTIMLINYIPELKEKIIYIKINMTVVLNISKY